MKNSLRGSAALLAATVIWGSAFIAQSVGMDLIEPFTFLTARCVLAVPFLMLVVFLFDREKRAYWKKWCSMRLWWGGTLCGAALFVAAGLQQVGLVSTAAGKAGFLTAMYIVLVPVLGLFLKKRPPATVWISVALAVLGLYLLSCMGVSQISFGDLCLAGCALAFAVQITFVDHFCDGLDGLRLNCIQSLVCGILASLMMFLTEQPVMANIAACWLPVSYAGILSTGIAYSLQIIGQQHLSPAPAALIMSLESVFAVLCGWLILHESMTLWEGLGCVLVFSAVIISQIPTKKQD